MDRRLKLSIAVSVPLAAASLACAYALLIHNPTARAPTAMVEDCRREAELMYDVAWAAACLKTADDSADCTLPDAQAAKVNNLLTSEQARCMAAGAQAKSEER
jgi:hypothetical protein